MFGQPNPAARPNPFAAVFDSGPSSSGSGPGFSSRSSRGGPVVPSRSSLPSNGYVNVGLSRASAATMPAATRRIPTLPFTNPTLTSSPEIVTMDELNGIVDGIDEKFRDYHEIIERMINQLDKLGKLETEIKDRLIALETSSYKPVSSLKELSSVSPRRRSKPAAART